MLELPTDPQTYEEILEGTHAATGKYNASQNMTHRLLSLQPSYKAVRCTNYATYISSGEYTGSYMFGLNKNDETKTHTRVNVPTCTNCDFSGRKGRIS